MGSDAVKLLAILHLELTFMMSDNYYRSAPSQALSNALPYHYQPLQGRRSIRILELFPDRKGAPLRCNMLGVSLDDAPEYEALSYVWGAPEFCKRIFCGTEAIHITKNCSYALHHLRYVARSRFLWIDACCIDQKSERERNHQVGMMRDVYRNAQCTVVWLGKTTQKISSALEYIRDSGRWAKTKASMQYMNVHQKKCTEAVDRFT
jgi:hypothetical protein